MRGFGVGGPGVWMPNYFGIASRCCWKMPLPVFAGNVILSHGMMNKWLLGGVVQLELMLVGS